MPYIPHTEQDVREMLEVIGIDDIEQLFDEIPAELRCDGLEGVPAPLGEMEVLRLGRAHAENNGRLRVFAGAGAYDHHVPPAAWAIATRGEFYSAYTPYQAEASQGTLQLIYEYQSMMTALTATEVSNASLYDGASALAEAVLMAVRANRRSKSRRILMPRSVHPVWRRVVHSIVHAQGIELVELALDEASGTLDPATLEDHAGEDYAALVIPQPNFFGQLEAVDELTDVAAGQGWMSIAVVNPVTLALLKPPGEWGADGADIVVGDGQPLGAPLSFGGPYYGFMCTRQKFARQMPGRIVGRTVDADGREGFVLTLQAREQHIRRSKATSNICTNQGLVVTASTIHMALLGPEGLKRVAAHSWRNTHELVRRLEQAGLASRLYSGDYFHEVALRLSRPAAEVIEAMAERGILAGYDLGRVDAALSDCLLVCATEQRGEDDLDAYVAALAEVLGA